MKKFIENLVTDPTVTLETRELVRSLLKSAKVRKTGKFVTDGGSHECTIRDSEKKVLNRAGFNPQKLTLYDRVVIHGVNYDCPKEKKKRQFCNSFVYSRKHGFAEILKIVRFRDDESDLCGLFIRQLADEGKALNAWHITNIVVTDNIKFITGDDIEVPVITISTSHGYRAIKLANLWETD